MGALNSFYNAEQALTDDRPFSRDRPWDNMLYFSSSLRLFQVHQIPPLSHERSSALFWGNTSDGHTITYSFALC
ncbi:hypothetical protein [Microcoleus vaginatus]|uniref:hypothetical protein n=1 Tax=Microcoleus vaginatus TaxID=119532 RepID=UPI001F60D93E